MLDDEHIAAAEKMVLAEPAGKPPGQLAKLAALAVATVDPEGTRKRREHAERMERHSAPPRLAPVADTQRAHLYARTGEVSGVTAALYGLRDARYPVLL